jgi:hypothetical protein
MKTISAVLCMTCMLAAWVTRASSHAQTESAPMGTITIQGLITVQTPGIPGLPGSLSVGPFNGYFSIEIDSIDAAKNEISSEVLDHFSDYAPPNAELVTLSFQ